MKKFVLVGLASIFVSSALAITATKEYVDRSTGAVIVAATNIAGTVTSNIVTKSYVEGLGIDAGINETTATNIACTVTSNIVTKSYVEGLGIDAGINETTATNIAGTVTSNIVTKSYVEGIGIESMPNNGVILDINRLFTKDAILIAPENIGITDYSDVRSRAYSSYETNSVRFNCDVSSIVTNKVDAFSEWKLIGVANVTETNDVRILDFDELFGWILQIDGVSVGANYSGSKATVLDPNRWSGDPRYIVSGVTTATRFKYETNALGLAMKSELESTQSIVETWEGFLDGSNVVFSITNYISGAYNQNEAKLKILEMREGQYQEVYNSRDEIRLHLDGFRTNEFVSATNAIVDGVDAKIADKADRAWGKYTSAGGVAPSNTVYMTAPSTVFAGGLEYERVAVGEGMVGILTTKGAPTYTTGDEGTFKFQDDGGTNFFGFAKTDSYVIGCNTDGISVQNHIVTLTYNVTMSGVPCIWYCPTLDVKPLVWEQLNTPDGQPIAGASHTVTWEASPAAGTEVCYLNCPEAKGFFKATIEVAGSAKFMTNMPADLGGGIICSNTVTGVNGIIRPTFNGSSVTWSWSAQ